MGEKLQAANAGTARVTVTAKNGKFDIAQEIDTTPAIVAPADYGKLLQAESALREKSARAFLLQAN